VHGQPVIELARSLVSLSEQGLGRLQSEGFSSEDETGFLEPLHELLDAGASLGEQTLARWRGAWGGSLDRLIEHTRY
jgi:glutamate--cysteine ligase